MHNAGLMMSFLLSTLLIIGLIYGGLVAGLYAFQRSLMYHPDQTIATPQTFGVPEMSAERILTVDGFALHSWWRAPTGPDAPVLVYFHGNAGHLGDRGGEGS